MRRPKIGLLPLYIELYDRTAPEVRPRIDSFHSLMAARLGGLGLDVVTVPVCRLKDEFSAAVDRFQREGVDGIITLHLAYSPSLEAADALAGTRLPLFVLDTTPTYSFGPGVDPDEIMYNHGIHGVQDLCNVLRRRGKRFTIEAGHWECSDVLKRAAAWARAAAVGDRMRHSRVGQLGSAFEGMGDFAVPRDVLSRSIGVEVVDADLERLQRLLPSESAPEVDAEMNDDLARFRCAGLDSSAHRTTTRVCLAVRRWMEQLKLSAFTISFSDPALGQSLSTLPFLEAGKAMARGVGYAGEGDALTAAFTGALMAVWPETSFVEMFCPDWEGGSILLSHMGEMNPDLAAGGAELLHKPMSWLSVPQGPVVALGRFKGGRAVFADLAPGPDDTFTLIVAPVEVLEAAADRGMENEVRGWIRPPMPLGDFLAAYSREGGTHHAALIYGVAAEEVANLAAVMDWKLKVLK